MSSARGDGPLARSLGNAEGHVVLLVRPPDELHGRPDPLPAGVRLRSGGGDRADVVLAWRTTRRQVEQGFGAWSATVDTTGVVWVAWPARPEGWSTDLTDPVVRDAVAPTGGVAAGSCTLGATWQALGFLSAPTRR